MDTHKTLTVAPVGTDCDIIVPRDKSIAGQIIAIKIESSDRVSYQVAWWSGRSRYTDWFAADAIAVSPGMLSCRAIGFLIPNNDGKPTDNTEENDGTQSTAAAAK